MSVSYHGSHLACSYGELIKVYLISRPPEETAPEEFSKIVTTDVITEAFGEVGLGEATGGWTAQLLKKYEEHISRLINIYINNVFVIVNKNIDK